MESITGKSKATKLLADFEKLEIKKELFGGPRNKRYVFRDCLGIFQ